MNHFDYRNGVLHAEAVNLSDLARRGRHAVLLLFDRHAGAPLPGVQRSLCRREGAGLLRHEGQLQPVGAAHAGEARRRRRRGVGRRIEARAGRRHSAEQDSVLRHRQDRGRTARGAGRRHPLHQRRIRTRTRTAFAARDRDRQDRADLGSGQSRCRFRHPCQNRDRQIREQVRRADCARARGLCPRRQAAGHSRSPASTCISAARSPI